MKHLRGAVASDFQIFQPVCFYPIHRASIGRLGVNKLGLYQIHWPAFATNFWCNDAFVQVRL